MLSFEWGWALLLLPLPWLARMFLSPAKRSNLAITVPLLNRYHYSDASIASTTNRVSRLCLWLLWICLLLAASRPFWLAEPISRSESGRDLILAVDISGSMSEADMRINTQTASRIDVLKIVVEKFIDRRKGDRLGLILFGTHAYSFVPLTFDLETLKTLLRDISTGLAGRHTAIGDAIGLAVKSMREQEAKHKVLILVTDGSNTAGFEDPVLAALAAAQQELTIYTIGVGSDAESLSRTYGMQSIPTGTAMNEAMLRKIAAVTGGEYFRAVDTAALEKIYSALDELEPVEHEYQSYRPRVELFMHPLVAGLTILMVFMLWSLWKSRRSRLSWTS